MFEADASILCTALGGDHNKGSSPVVDQPSLLLFHPETILQILRLVICGCSCTSRFLAWDHSEEYIKIDRYLDSWIDKKIDRYKNIDR